MRPSLTGGQFAGGRLVFCIDAMRIVGDGRHGRRNVNVMSSSQGIPGGAITAL